MKSISVKRDVLEELKAHALAIYPDEACGLIGGADGVGSRFYAVTNVEPSPVTYGLDPSEQIAAMRGMREAGLELVAIFHSHPGSRAVPSATDELRAYFPGTRDENFPGVAYIIAGLSRREVTELRAFIIASKGVSEIRIKAL